MYCYSLQWVFLRLVGCSLLIFGWLVWLVSFTMPARLPHPHHAAACYCALLTFSGLRSFVLRSFAAPPRRAYFMIRCVRAFTPSARALHRFPHCAFNAAAACVSAHFCLAGISRGFPFSAFSITIYSALSLEHAAAFLSPLLSLYLRTSWNRQHHLAFHFILRQAFIQFCILHVLLFCWWH